MNKVVSNKPYLLFQGGTHGNFLAKCLSVASGECDNFDFYNGLKGAHNIVKTSLKKEMLDYVVDFGHKDKNFKEIFCYINVMEEDLYLMSSHLFYAAGELGLDLLNINTWPILQKLCKDQPDHPVVSGGFGNQVEVWSQQGQSGLREMYKAMFNRGNGIITIQADHWAASNIANVFQFHWFYDLKKFTDNLKILLDRLGYTYKVDITQNWQQFIIRKKEIIKSKQLVEYAFRCYNKNIPTDISDFGFYEQAYLDHLIEQKMGSKIENVVKYATNTQDIHPIKAWEGKRYEL